MSKIHVDPEFSQLIVSLAEDERVMLEKSILAEGCRDALVVWLEEGILLDGHHRKEICDRHGIDYRVAEKPFANREDALLWVIDNQLGRRNLEPIDKVPLVERKRGIVEEAARERMLAGKGMKDPPPNSAGGIGETRDILATEAGVGRETYKALKTVLDEGTPELADAVRKHVVGASTAAIITRLSLGEQRELVAEGEKAMIAARKRFEISPHISQATGESEWYTPKDYIKAALAVMGGIDLDPASTEEANTIVGAACFYDTAIDGLAQDWRGRVWMNPPYSIPLVASFAHKLAEHVKAGDVTEAIVLVNNATETTWFSEMIDVASVVCFPRGRVRFWAPDRESSLPLQGQAVIYIGKNVLAFREAYAEIGWSAVL